MAKRLFFSREKDGFGQRVGGCDEEDQGGRGRVPRQAGPHQTPRHFYQPYGPSIIANTGVMFDYSLIP